MGRLRTVEKTPRRFHAEAHAGLTDRWAPHAFLDRTARISRTVDAQAVGEGAQKEDC